MSAGKVMFVAGTAGLAAVTGGAATVAALAVHAGLGVAAYAAHQAAVGGPISEDAASLKNCLKKEEKHLCPPDKAELNEGLRKLRRDQAGTAVASVAIGVLTFANPLIGLGVLGTALIGGLRNR